MDNEPTTNFFVINGSANNAQSVSGTGTLAVSPDYNPAIQWTVESSTNPMTGQIEPKIYFKYIKSKLGTIAELKLNARLKRLEKAFNKAVENGQEALGQKFLREIARETRESAIAAVGFKHFIEYEDLNRYKRNIKGGHISDTRFEDYTRVIPKDVLEKKKKADKAKLFDNYVIYHYWNPKAEEKRGKDQKMDEQEKSRMKDPVLFGRIKETSRLYFVADWEDEFCDLTFEEIVDVVGKDEEEITLKRDPEFKLN